jgi:hypothetical protein
MQRLLTALVSWFQNTANGMTSLVGASGPFLDVAPEGTDFPYMTYTVIGGLPNWQGFDTTYAARCHLQFTLRGLVDTTVATNTELVASKLDVLGSLPLTDGEITRKPIRIEEPRIVAEPIDEDGQRVYAGILEYRFNVARVRGV